MEKILNIILLAVVALLICFTGLIILVKFLHRITAPLSPISERLKLLSDGDVHTLPLQL